CPRPAEALFSTANGGGHELQAGTSMAAPLVAGAAALAWASMDSPTAEAVARRLLDTAWFDPGHMDAGEYGAGVLRLDRALGFPGPGDPVAVSAVGPGDASDQVTLDPFGSSS